MIKSAEAGNAAPQGQWQYVRDPADWSAADLLASQERWRHRWTSGELDDLLDLAARTERLVGGEADRLLGLAASDLPLGQAAAVVDHVRHELQGGLGLALLQGLPAGEIPLLHSAIVYWAIGRHLGTAMSNNPDGDMLGHVVDTGKDVNHPNHRGYQTRAGLDYHCDTSSIVGLLCLKTPKSGGDSKVVSSIAVYNEILRRAPQHLHTLSQPFCWSLHGEVNKGEKGYFESPVFNFLEGQLCVSFGPTHMFKGHKVEGAPPISEAQVAAIRFMEDICDELQFSMQLEVGDIQLINNGVALHTRTSYDDWPEPERKRHLWRLWLDAPSMRARTAYQMRYLGGVKLRGTRERIVLAPEFAVSGKAAR